MANGFDMIAAEAVLQVREEYGDIVLIAAVPFRKQPLLLAITGGKPFSAFLLADAVSCELKTIWYQSEFYFWKDELN